MYYLNLNSKLIHESKKCCDHNDDRNDVCKVINELEAIKLLKQKRAKICDVCNPKIDFIDKK